MTTHPTTGELLQAVMSWLDGMASAEKSSRDSYMALVARNALGIVQRELAQGPEADNAAQERLVTLLGMHADLATLEAELSARIRNGTITPDNPGLLHHLRLQTAARLAIDQPRYKPAP